MSSSYPFKNTRPVATIAAGLFFMLTCMFGFSQSKKSSPAFDSPAKRFEAGGLFEGYSSEKEVVSDRVETSKTFENGDGTRTMVSTGSPVHYKAANGDLLDIDPNVKLSVQDKYAYENVSNTFRTYFPRSFDGGNGISLRHEAGNIRFGINSEMVWIDPSGNETLLEKALNSAPSMNHNKVVYSNFFSLVDNEYEIGNNTIKNNFHINSLPVMVAGKQGYLGIAEMMELPDGWVIQSDGKTITGRKPVKGGVTLVDGTGQVVYDIPFPEVYEAANPGNQMAADGAVEVSYIVEPVGGKYRIIMMIDLDWLTDANRQFPVVADPTVTFNGGNGGWMNTSGSSLNNGGFVFTGNYSGSIYRAWIVWSTAAIPDASVITDVDARFYLNGTSANVSSLVRIYDITANQGPYGGYNATNYNDFGNGSQYTAFNAGFAGNYYGFYDLGTAADANLQARLGANWFQVGMTNTTTTWKRFTASLSQLRVTYIACSALSGGSVSGGGTICTGGNLGTFGNSASASGGATPYTYQWQQQFNCSGGWSNISGATGTTYNPPALTSTRCFRRRVIDGCNANPSYTNTLVVSVVADPSISISGGATICVGGNRTLSASASGGTGSCTYQWQRATSTSGPWSNVGTNSSSYNTGGLSSTFVYRCLRICSGNGCGTATSNTQTVTVVSDPSISISGGTTICAGGNQTLSSSTSGGTGTCSYQWQRATSASGPWSNVGGNASTYNTGTLTSTFVYRVLRSCNGSGCGTATSNTQTVTVVPDPSISISSSGTICTGGNRTLTASVSNGVSCSTQWQVATSSSGPWSNTGSNSTSFNTGSLTSTRFYRAVRNCTGSGCSDPISNIVTVTVVADPSISISGGTTICTGGNRTLSASTSGGTGTCSFQWQRATSTSGPWTNVGGNSSSYNTGTLTSTFVYRCQRICNGSGCGTATSNTQTVTVVPDPSISISSSGTICTGGNQTLNASVANGTGCSTQWQVATSSSGPWSNVGSNSTSYNTGTLTATRFYRAVRNCTGSGCSDPISNTVTITVVPDPSISISSSGTICSGGNLSLTASTSNGVGCSTQWQVASSSSGPWTNTGTNSNSYNTGALTATRFYRAVRNCTGSGCSDPISNTVTVTVVADPSISITGAASICTGGNQTLTASASGGTGSCTYQWQRATSTSGPWTNVGANSSTYNTGTLTSTFVYRCQRICSGNGCGTATSNTQTITVVPDPSVSISGGGTICSGGNTTLSASASGGTGTCTFQWQRATSTSGPWTNVGGNSSTYNTGTLTSTFVYRVVRSCSGSGCGTATSNTQTVTVAADPSISASGGGIFCPGGNFTFTSSTSGGTGSCSYQWQSAPSSTGPWTNVGPNSASFNTGALSNTTFYRVQRICTGSGCGTATSNVLSAIRDNINPVAVCQNATVQLNSSGNGSVTSGQINNGSSDNCTISSLSVSPNSFNCSNVGNNTVTLTVTDNSSNSSTCTATVNVQDNVAPNAVCQNLTVQLNSSGNGSITAAQVNNGSNDNCGIASLTVTPSAFSCSNVGNNTVTLTVTDVNNNTSTCTSVINVQDNVAPNAVCQNITVQLNSGGNASITAAQINNGSSDACGIASLTVAPNSFNCSDVGNNTVTLTVTDNNSNVSTCTATVNVVDIIAPNAICQNLTVQLNSGGNASITAAQVNNGSNDNCGIASLSVNPSTFNCSNVGNNSVTLLVTDVNNNSDTCNATITIQDNIAPTAVCQNVTVQLNASGNGSLTAAQVNNGSSDNCAIASISVSQTSFNCSNVGNNTVVLTVTDVNNNTSTCTAVVSVQDNVNPVAVCQNITVQLSASGNASITASQINNGSSDACGIASLAVSPNSFTCSNVGANTVTLTVTDVNNNSSTCNATVTVQDNVPPVALCQNVTVQLNSGGNASITASQVNNGSSDACGIASLAVSPSTFSCSNVGSNTVTLTVTDVNNNSSTCTATVNVQDNISPTALCQNVTVQLNASGNGSVTAAQVNNGSSDNCAIASLVVAPNGFTCANVGPNTVVLTVTDVNNNVSTCSATATVQDNVAPNAICQNTTVSLDINGNGSIIPADVDGGSTDACGISSLTVAPNTFDCSNIGANTVTLTVTDVNNNVSTCTATVTVQDTIAPPPFVCPANVVLPAAFNNCAAQYVWIDPTVTDNCSQVTVTSVSSTASITKFSNINIGLFPVGVNTVTVTATDGSNNTTVCSFTVTVEDNQNPIITGCPTGPIVVSNSPGQCSATPTFGPITASDNCPAVTLVGSNLSGSVFPLGTTNVVFTATDASNNTTTCTFDVTVNDTEAPNAVCQNISVQLNSGGNATITASSIDGGTTDNCGLASVTASPLNFSCSDVGVNTVTLTATDVNSNTSTCTASVTVQDITVPTAVCQNVTLQLDASGNATLTAAAVDGGSTDNCTVTSNLSRTVSPNAFTCSDVGANSVTLTITDQSNNTSTCTATVNVQDNIAPTAICQNITINLVSTAPVTVSASQIDNGSNDACGIASLSVTPNTFSCATPGSNSVTLTVIDNNSNTSTCAATVFVQDNVAPTASCQNITVQLNSSGNASITAADVDNGSSDACGTVSLAVSPTSFTCANVGSNTVTLTVTDLSNNVSTCNATVTIQDNTAPAAVCQNVTVQLDAFGNASVAASAVDNGSSDACGIGNLALSTNSFTCSDVGANTVTLTVTDVNSNTSSCSSTVTVEDNVAPTASCQNVTVQLNGSGSGSISTLAVNNNSSDNCGIASLSLSQTTFACADVGNNTVTLTVTDVNSNTSTCTATVLVEDNIAPTAVCQNLTLQLDGSGNASITATDVNNGSSDNCGIASLAINQTAFGCVNVGPNPVTLTVTDVNGNTSTCVSSAIVQDLVAPTAICQDITINLVSTTPVTVTPSQIDNGSNDACGIASLNLSPNTFSCATPGVNPVTLTVTDVNNNVSTCTANVTVQDNVAPTALCQNLTVQLNASGNAAITAQDIDNGSADACGSVTISASPTSFTCSNVGPNTVTLTVTDLNNNVSTCTSTVTVEDNIAPTAICQNLTIQLNASGAGSTTAAAVDNGSSDNCGIASVTLSQTSFGCADVGQNSETLTVTDVNGNTSTCQASIVVQDNIAPAAVCQNVTVTLNSNGLGTLSASQVNNGSNDACGIGSISLDNTQFACSDVGANTVTLTVTDNNGNTSTCTATATVTDNTAPIAACQNVTVQLNASGNGSVTAQQVNSGSSDACGIASLSVSPNAFTCSDVGANTVVLTVTDVNNNTSTCTATVAVEDNVAPNSVCQNITVQLDGSGNATILPADVDGGSSDACGIASLVLNNNTFGCADIGGNSVSLTVTDNNGNTSLCVANVTVQDTVAPNAVCQNVTVQLGAFGSASVSASQVDGGSGDNCGVSTISVSPNSFTCLNVGPNTVTLTVLDDDNNASTCTATVTVEDNVPPVALCQSVTVQLDGSGNGSTTAANVNNGSADNCGVALLSLSQTAFTCADIGANTVTLTVTDVNSNTSTCTANVTVEDNIAPVAVCQNITVNLNAGGNGSATAASVDNGSTDNCAVTTFGLSQTAFTCADIGANTETMTVSDASGNTSTCTTTITVIDAVAPVALCQAVTVQLNGSGNGSVNASDINNGSTDACGIASLSVSPNSFTCSDVGANTVTLTVTDVNSNTSTCTATVTVEDNTPPVALCQTITVQLDAAGNGSATAASVDAGSSDACGIASLSLSPNTFTCADVGQTLATLTVTDVNNNSATCQTIVVVEDNVAPNAICQNITLQLSPGGSATILAADVDGGSNDACGIASLSVNPNSFSCANVSNNTVTLTVTDVNNNVSTCTATVSVVDTVPPVAVCQNATVQLDAAGNGSVTAADVDGGSSDNCAITGLSVSPNAFTCADVGANTVTLTVTDVNSNSSTCTATVTVEDNVAPVAICQNVTVQLNGGGSATVTASQVDGGSTDACGIASLSVSPSSFTCANVGGNAVTLTVTDVNGNVSTCISNVTVLDTVGATAVCQNITVQLDAGGNASISASDVDGGSGDNCGVTGLTVSPNSFTCANVGPNSVTLTVTDVNNNVTTCTAIVTVEDTIAPIAICQNITVQLDANGQSTIAGNDIDNGSTDACGIVSLSLNNTTYGCADVGSNVVTLTATDVNNNTSTCTAQVIVEDTIAPDAICQAIVLYLDTFGIATIVPGDVDGGSYDNCGIQNMVLGQDTFTCADVASVTPSFGLIISEYLEGSGDNKAVEIFNPTQFTVDLGADNYYFEFYFDGSPTPSVTINLTGSIVSGGTYVLADDGASFAILARADQTSTSAFFDGNDAVVLVKNGVRQDIFGSIGQNPGTAWTAGTKSTLDQTLVRNPIITNGWLFNIPGFVQMNSQWIGYPTDYYNNLGGHNVNNGFPTVTLTVTDVNGNFSSCNAPVGVFDTIAPAAKCKDITVYLATNGTISINDIDVSNNTYDACGIHILDADPTFFDCSNIGQNTVTLVAADITLNYDTCFSTVTVLDTISPIAICQNITVQLDGNGSATIVPGDLNNGSGDACGVDTLFLDRYTFGCGDIGSNPVVLTAVDVNNNSSACLSLVTVQDTVAPVAVCQNITVNLDVTGTAGISPVDVDGGSLDGCGIVGRSLDVSFFNCSNVGPNTVTLTVVDGNNNVSTCTATVTVQDLVAPAALCQNITVQLDASGNASIVPGNINSGSSDACGIASFSLSQTTFACSNVGANTVTLTVTDVNNNVSTCTGVVNVLDNIAPTALCQDVTVYLGANGNATIAAQDVDNGSTDACGIASLNAAPTTFGCGDVNGSNAVVLIVTDVNNNNSTCVSNVTVLDTVAPVAVCQNITVQLNSIGSASITALDIDGGSGDACSVSSISASPTTFSCTNVGPNSVTLTVTDGNNNVSTCTATVTIEDNIAPTALCQNVTIQLDANGNASINTGDVNNGSTDACGIASLSLNQTAFTCADIGANMVTLTATDVSSNVTTCTATVTVQDVTAPIAICQSVTVQLDGSGNATVTAADLGSNSTDNCGTVNLTASQTSFGCSDIGSNLVAVTASDGNGNSSFCFTTVVVEDTVPPVAVCQNITVQLSPGGSASISASNVNNGSSDNCGIDNISIDVSTFSCANVGPNAVTLTVTDDDNNVSTCTATVTVEDNVAPVALCQGVTVQLNSSGNASITAGNVNSGSSDACGIASLSVSPNAFTCADVGSNTVTLTVTDVNNNSSTCTATVVVEDNVAPVAVCQNITINLDATGNATITPADVNNGSNDNCGIANLSLSQTAFNCSNVGQNAIILTVTDVDNNVSTCQAVVTVNDSTPPVAICQNITVQLNGSGSATITVADINNGSNDNCGLNGLSLSQTNFGCADVGVNTVTLTATDVNNNVTSCSATVTVEDTVAPVAVCQNITVSLDASGNASITAQNVDGGSSDNCGTTTLSASPNTFTCSDLGANTVTLTVTDQYNNTSTCTATVTVEDNVAPTAICQNLTIQLDALGNGTLTAANVNNGSSDACGIASVSLSQTAFGCGDVGNNAVTLTVTDVNNNTSTCQATIRVEDNIAPTAVCQNITVQLDAGGVASIQPGDIDGGSTDACGIIDLDANPSIFSCGDVGANAVVLTVTDVNGNVSTCTSTVTVEDNVAPNAVCQNLTVLLDNSGNASIVPGNVNGGSTDACGISGMTIDISTFTCADVGPNTVTLTVTDVNNNVSTCTATASVLDLVDPVAICQDVTAYLDVNGNGTVTAQDVDNGSNDACGIATLALTGQQSFSCADIGDPNIYIFMVVTDVNNNNSLCSSLITVEDTVPPTAICQDITVQLDVNGDASITLADINNGTNDACGIDTLFINPTTFNCSNVGANTVTLTAIDIYNNVSTCTANVTLEDTIPPVALCQDITVQLDASGNASITGADVDNGSNDACGITLAVNPNAFTCADVGANTVVLTVTDVNNNVSTCTSIVTVEDTIAPVAVCQNITVQLDVTGNVTITPQDVDGGSADACGIASLTIDVNAFTCADVGPNTVVLTVTDVNNNVSSCSSIVTVEDTVPPVALCQNITIQLDVVGNASITPQDVDNGSNDACGIASLSVAPNTFTCANVGPNTVTLTVTDVNNNVSTCSSIVTVEDTVPPVALCQDITVQLDAGGNAAITPQDVDNGSNDACGIASLSVNPNTFNCANVGANTVTLTVTDVNNNVSTCTSNVTVEDTVPPVALCQDITVQLDAGGNAAITPQDVDNGSNDACGIASLSVNPNTFNCANVGPNTVTLTVTDVNNNVSTCSSIVTVEDTVPPVALCQDITVQLDASGNAAITPQDVDNGSNDACGIASLSVNPNTFNCANVGANTVTLTVTDVNNNVSTCTSNVTVEDNVPPVAICQDITVQLDAGGNAAITPQDVDNGSNDACGIASLSVNPNTFNCSNVGANTVTLTVTDVNNNVSTCTSNVTVEDTVPPVALCQDITVQLDAGGNAAITPQDVDNGSNDACGIASLSVNPNTFNCANVGPNTVTLIVTDVNNNVSTCSSIVTVEDNVPPVAICQDITVQLDAGGNAAITPLDVDNGSNDACGIASLSVNPNTFNCSNVGGNTVTLTVTDVNNNLSTCSSNVTVEDTVPPVAICQDITVQLNGGGSATIAPQDVDNGSNDACGIASLSVNPNTFTCSTVGPNTVTLTVTDVNNNVSTCTANVSVLDTVPPVAVCQNITVQLDASGNASITAQDVDGGSTDACNLLSLTVNPNAFTCANVGPNTVTLTATDVNNNVSTCTATVTIEDNVAPTAICQNITVQLDASGNASITPQDIDNGSNDACGIASLSVNPNAFTCADVGANTVTLSVTDVNNNTGTCTSTVTVEDITPPVAVCQNVTVQLDASGNAAVNPQDIDNGSNDACGIASLSVNPNAFTCADVGVNAVTLTVTDVNNNVSTCTATVNVEDNVAPVAVCQNITVQLDASGNASIAGQDVDGGSTDACGIASLAVNPNAFTCADVGANTVTLTVTDVNNNVSTCTATVNVEDNVAPVAVCQSITINLGSSGSTTVTPQDIDNGSNDACGIASLSLTPNVFDCSNQGANTVTLTVTDVNNNTSTCTATVTVTVDPIVATASSPTFTCGFNVSCNGANDGSATVAVTGGCLPYSYLWSNGQTTATAVNLTAGTYTVTVTDLNSNTTTATVTLTEPAPLVAVTNGTNISCFGDADGAVDLTVTGGATCQAYTFSWTGPGGFTATTEDISNLIAGTYNVTITDANGCTTTGSVTLTEPTPLVADAFSGAQTTICENFPVILGGSPTASGGTGPYTYLWSPAAGLGSTTDPNPFAILTATSTYYLTVTDANGCTATDSVTVNVISVPVVTIVQSSVPGNCQGAAVTLTATVSGGSGIFTYQWDDINNSTTQSIVATTNGQYTAVVFDSLGCEAKDTIIVTINPQALASAYTIIGFDEVDIANNSTVLNGGVGVKQPGNRIRVRGGSQVTAATTFAMASVIQTPGGGAVTTQILAPSPVNVPNFLWNPFQSTNNVNVGSGQTVTLTDSVYGTIQTGNNATVIFTRKDIYVQTLITGNNVTIQFAGCTFLRVRDRVTLGRNVNFNPDNYPVSVFEEETGITVNRGSTINANMFTLQTLTATGNNNNPVAMNGQFIGFEVVFSNNVTANWNTNCDPTCEPSPNPVFANCNCTDNLREVNLSYSGTAGAQVIAYLDATRNDTLGIFNNVQINDTLFIASAADGSARFNATTIFSVNGGNNIAVPTACGTSMLGQVTGPFTMESWVDGDGQTCIPGAPSKVIEVATEEPAAQSGASAATEAQRDLNLSAHPNPFSESTTVRFTVPADDQVEVRIYNISGQLVEVLFEGEAMGNLTYDFEWRPENITNGLYTVKLVTQSGQVLHKKLVLSR